ncbi:hypothetical protein [Paraburkholderia haematera]|nr:hypothetical protein [Paraburkholderia haematera]
MNYSGIDLHSNNSVLIVARDVRETDCLAAPVDPASLAGVARHQTN